MTGPSEEEIATHVNIVAIGGGTGLATLLSGLKLHVDREIDGFPAIGELSAIVAVSDDGGSSGRLRDELKMPPPGDIRNCMVALSEDSTLLAKLFQHRFSGSGDLSGHSFGNLFLAALAEITGDFTEAVRLSSEILASKGRIYPATVANSSVAAELDDGTIVRGETSVSSVGPRIKRLFIDPENCQPHPDAVSAIARADLITLGPGSLFTSLLPPVLVRGIAESVAASKGRKAFICNLMTQPGETDGFSAARHLEVVKQYAPDVNFDYLLVNKTQVSDEQARAYFVEGAEQIGVHGSIADATVEGAAIVYADLLDEGPKVRHKPAKLARAVLSCVMAD